MAQKISGHYFIPDITTTASVSYSCVHAFFQNLSTDFEGLLTFMLSVNMVCPRHFLNFVCNVDAFSFIVAKTFVVRALTLLLMRTKGKGKVRISGTPNVRVDGSERVCDIHAATPVGVHNPAVTADGCLLQQGLVHGDPHLKRKFVQHSFGAEPQNVKRLAPSDACGCSTDVAAACIGEGFVKLLVSDITGGMLAQLMPGPNSLLCRMVGASRGPVILNFAAGTFSPALAAGADGPTARLNINGKRLLDVVSNSDADQGVPLKRKRMQLNVGCLVAEDTSNSTWPTVSATAHQFQRDNNVYSQTGDCNTYVCRAMPASDDSASQSVPAAALSQTIGTDVTADSPLSPAFAFSVNALTLNNGGTQPHPAGLPQTGATNTSTRGLHEGGECHGAHHVRAGPPNEYRAFGRCECICSYCHAKFWYKERLAASTRRTARDKLREADVPEFKVRLFNVVGSAQHELPTADAIGAIVFDAGAETDAEFDIIVETHSGEPQRISRLYPCYMALHFPLLLIYGEQGYHTDLRLIDVQRADRQTDKQPSEMFQQVLSLTYKLTNPRFCRTIQHTNRQTATPPLQEQEGTSRQPFDERARDKGKQIMVEQEDIDIMNLKPEDFGKPLDLKVYRKWISKNIPDPSPTGISFILLDKKGGAIQASGQLPDMRQLDTRLQLDMCYRIQGYGCKRTDNWQRTLENKITLLFGRFTQAAPIQDEGFPSHYFNFAAYNEVCRRADTREPILTDYVGIIRNIGTIREFGDASTNIISRRNIDVQNLNGNTVMLTLWNELAADFPVARVEQMEHPVVIAASSCWAKRHAGVIQLSSTPATSIYLNPEVPTAEHIQEVYKELMGSAPPMQLQTTEGTSVQDRGRRQTMTLAAIMGAAIQNTMQQHFVTDAVIVKIDESKGWYFNRCRSCGNPVEEYMPHRHCHEPGTVPQPNYSYCFRATLADVTGSIVVACYSPAAHSLVPNITEVLTFQLHLGKGSRRGYPNFILDHASEISPTASPERFVDPEVESSSTPIRNIVIEQEAIEITPGSVSPPASTGTPGHTILRITAAETQTHAEPTETSPTPESPATAGTTMTTEAETSAETTETDGAENRPAVRRNLFPQSEEEGPSE
ncbi:nucleic acid-binding, OB-fold protein [Artemisia annua]|uniref:Nucleic acid-binding, OB-fold protein n=1 Tax=Artemisia annua TaxID=35608 RepID=A0A2U1QHS9_ARTAN|nr:nucleic acid-binding, OB-fold protein [Artemisia annua]